MVMVFNNKPALLTYVYARNGPNGLMHCSLNYKLQSLNKTGMALSWAAAAFSFANTPLFEMS